MAKHLLCLKDLFMRDDGEQRFTKGRSYPVIVDKEREVALIDDIGHEHYIKHPSDVSDQAWDTYFTASLSRPPIAKPDRNVKQYLKEK